MNESLPEMSLVTLQTEIGDPVNRAANKLQVGRDG